VFGRGCIRRGVAVESFDNLSVFVFKFSSLNQRLILIHTTVCIRIRYI